MIGEEIFPESLWNSLFPWLDGVVEGIDQRQEWPIDNGRTDVPPMSVKNLRYGESPELGFWFRVKSPGCRVYRYLCDTAVVQWWCCNIGAASHLTDSSACCC